MVSDTNYTEPGTSVGRRTVLKMTGGLSAVGITGLSGCLGDDQTALTISGGPSGSTTDAAGQALVRAVNEHSDTVNLSVTESGGWVANSQLYDQGEVEAIGMDNFNGLRALTGGQPYDEQPIDELPYQGFGYDRLDNWMMAAEGSDIESTDDLIEQTVWVIAPGMGTRVAFEEVLIESGYWDEIEHAEMGPGDLAGAIEEGRVVALPGQGSMGVQLLGFHNEVDARNDLYAIEASEAFVDGIENTDGLELRTFEPYGYNQDVTRLVDEVTGFALTAQWRFGPEVENETVYEIMRISHEYTDFIRESDASYMDHGDVSRMTEFLLDDQPVHPGAAEFYEDHGVWNDDWEVGE